MPSSPAGSEFPLPNPLTEGEGANVLPSRPAGREFLDGVLLLNKPVGLTSNTALQKAKRLLNAKKAGHTGTLDPFADGLLPLCFGEATKFSHYLLDADKTYHAVMQLGVTTTTGDPEGEVLSTRAVNVSRDAMLAALQRFVGAIEQIPPMHSALKHQGRPLYEYARAGIEIDRPPRQVTIHTLDLIECAPPHIRFAVRCSAGTYIRMLAQDIGEVLGCGAHLIALTRTASGLFDLKQAHTLDQLETLVPDERRHLLLPVDCLVQHLPEIELDAAACLALRQGRQVSSSHEATELARIYDQARQFIGLAYVDPHGTIVSRRLIHTANKFE